jgi:hypothetical protein
VANKNRQQSDLVHGDKVKQDKIEGDKYAFLGDIHINPPKSSWQPDGQIHVVLTIAVASIIVALIGIVSVVWNSRTSNSSAPLPQPLIVDNLDSTLGWSTYDDKKGSSITIDSVAGKTNNAIKIFYSLGVDGWVDMARDFHPGFLVDTKAIRFDYMGDGAPNSIELKLLYKPDTEGKSAVFSVLRNRITNTRDWNPFTRDWASLEISYSDFVCWTDTGCQAGEKIDLNKISRIDFAVSNKKNDTPGIGVLILDNIQGVK